MTDFFVYDITHDSGRYLVHYDSSAEEEARTVITELSLFSFYCSVDGSFDCQEHNKKIGRTWDDTVNDSDLLKNLITLYLNKYSNGTGKTKTGAEAHN